jgi:hypothetical protein
MDQQAVSRHTADEISLSLPRFLHISLHGGGQEKKRTSPGQQKTGQGAEHHTPPWVDWEFLATNRFCAPYCVVRRLFRTAQWHPECAIARVRLESLHSRRVRPQMTPKTALRSTWIPRPSICLLCLLARAVCKSTEHQPKPPRRLFGPFGCGTTIPGAGEASHLSH